VLVEGLESVGGIAAGANRSYAVTQSGEVFPWGASFLPDAAAEFRPILVWGVRVRRACACGTYAYAIGNDGELFSWGCGEIFPCVPDFWGLLGHGIAIGQSSPKRVEALRGVQVTDVSVGMSHALALAEDGLVYAWGRNMNERAVLGHPNVESEPLPKPVKALRGVRVGSVAAACARSYAVTDTGELWAWGCESSFDAPLGHGNEMSCPLPKPIASLRGIKVDAMAASDRHTLALADDGSVYAWGNGSGAKRGALGLGPAVRDAGRDVPTPQRIPALRVACGW
jgi:alpha-tubulin suppressor-like RCC1 family protein